MTADQATSQADPLAKQLLRHAQLISELRRDLNELANITTDTTADFLSRLEEVQDASGAPRTPSAWCWRTLGPEAKKALWRELDDWVTWIRARYPLARKIPPCWTEHPEVVEELTALWLAWQYAYEERDAPLTAAADWHDRWLPGVLHRLQHGALAIDCSNTHQPRPTAAYAKPTLQIAARGGDAPAP